MVRPRPPKMSGLPLLVVARCLELTLAGALLPVVAALADAVGGTVHPLVHVPRRDERRALLLAPVADAALGRRRSPPPAMLLIAGIAEVCVLRAERVGLDEHTVRCGVPAAVVAHLPFGHGARGVAVHPARYIGHGESSRWVGGWREEKDANRFERK